MLHWSGYCRANSSTVHQEATPEPITGPFTVSILSHQPLLHHHLDFSSLGFDLPSRTHQCTNVPSPQRGGPCWIYAEPAPCRYVGLACISGNPTELVHECRTTLSLPLEAPRRFCFINVPGFQTGGLILLLRTVFPTSFRTSKGLFSSCVAHKVASVPSRPRATTLAHLRVAVLQNAKSMTNAAW
jgi:hypothetical protein